MSNRLCKGKLLNQRLFAYSATATAALAGASVAQADITLITSGTTGDLIFSGSAVTPLNLPSIEIGTQPSVLGEFKFGGFSSTRYLIGNHIGSFDQIAIMANVAYATTSQNLALKLGLGDAIAGTGRAFSAFDLAPVFAQKSSMGVFGNFQQALGGTGYFGFKLVQNMHTYYGWMRAKVTFSGSTPTGISLVPKIGTTNIYGAYGDNTMTAGAIPEPSVFGLGLLALGAAGVREMRRRRKTAASA